MTRMLLFLPTTFLVVAFSILSLACSFQDVASSETIPVLEEGQQVVDRNGTASPEASEWKVDAFESPGSVHEPPFLVGDTLAWIGWSEDEGASVYLRDLGGNEITSVSTPSYSAEDLAAADGHLAWVGVQAESDPSGEFQVERNVIFIYEVETGELKKLEQGFAQAVWAEGSWVVWRAADKPLVQGLLGSVTWQPPPGQPVPKGYGAYSLDLMTGKTHQLGKMLTDLGTLGGGILSVASPPDEDTLDITQLETGERRPIPASGLDFPWMAAGEGYVAWVGRGSEETSQGPRESLHLYEWERDETRILDLSGQNAADPVLARGRLAARTGPGDEFIGITVWDVKSGQTVFSWDQPPERGANSLYDFSGEALAWVVPEKTGYTLYFHDLLSGRTSTVTRGTIVPSDVRFAGTHIVWVSSELREQSEDGQPLMVYRIHVATPLSG